MEAVADPQIEQKSTQDAERSGDVQHSDFSLLRLDRRRTDARFNNQFATVCVAACSARLYAVTVLATRCQDCDDDVSIFVHPASCDLVCVCW